MTAFVRRIIPDAFTVSILLLGGCGNVPEPGSGQLKISSAAVTAFAVGAAYVHTANNSKFRVGTTASTMSEFGFTKLVGKEGVFATLSTTGWVLALPNANAPSIAVAPLTQSEAVHNRAVVNYFSGAGLPTAQIGEVHAHPSMHASGQSGVDNISNNLTFEGYTSVITRVVAGILVPDSFAL
jgi:hypothetical protein